MIKKINPLFLFVRFFFCFSVLMLLFGCSPASKAVKRGDEYLETRNYYSAAKEYINALSFDPTYEKAKTKLCEVSKQAYDQQLAIASNYERTSNHETALQSYTDISNFLDNVSNNKCLTFPAINVKNKITEMKSVTSEKYYKEAESFFNNVEYDAAISKYEEALKFNSPYKDCTEKITESHYSLGVRCEKQKAYRDAAKKYLKANQVINGYKDATARATKIYYALGEYFLSMNQCRNAWNDFNEITLITPGYLNINDKLAKAEDCSVAKIAFARFDNPTGRNIAGSSIGDMVFDSIKAKLQGKSSRFLHFMEREELDSIFNEQSLGVKGITDEYSSFKKLKGVNYLIFGKLTQVNSTLSQPKTEQMKTTGSYYVACVKYDRKGKPYDSTCSRNKEVYYSKNSQTASVSLTGSIKILSVLTGQQAIFHNISVKKSDNVSYANNFSDDLSTVAVPDNVKTLANARQELADEDSLVKKIVEEIGDSMVKEILNKIDTAASLKDPETLKIKF